jgi:hypothetical protein
METFTTMTQEQRTKLVEAIAEVYLDSVSVKDLESFFFEAQVDCLQSYSDEELLTEATGVFEEDEVDAILA